MAAATAERLLNNIFSIFRPSRISANFSRCSRSACESGTKSSSSWPRGALVGAPRTPLLGGALLP
eukprot:CAMPEP_0115389126 /NCGR_PEP_ID=MMETSP0271-20121206/9529_1 /TAXON_ID=71861 /ORGANISM="Scrippsiella trochoidea, Strain CCMP3099" /LENGTH=64 /DNA_ID=CAMNT_0002812635 /DNA_START=30 /DNA_END=221 /DNA_ORIENTATION=+